MECRELRLGGPPRSLEAEEATGVRPGEGKFPPVFQQLSKKNSLVVMAPVLFQLLASPIGKLPSTLSPWLIALPPPEAFPRAMSLMSSLLEPRSASVAKSFREMGKRWGRVPQSQ